MINWNPLFCFSPCSCCRCGGCLCCSCWWFGGDLVLVVCWCLLLCFLLCSVGLGGDPGRVGGEGAERLGRWGTVLGGREGAEEWEARTKNKITPHTLLWRIERYHISFERAVVLCFLQINAGWHEQFQYVSVKSELTWNIVTMSYKKYWKVPKGLHVRVLFASLT